jgi:preprotein translocase subunit SecD
MSIFEPRYLWPASLVLLFILGLVLTLRIADPGRSRARLLVSILVVMGFGVYLVAINPVFGMINQGLDLKGGVHVVLEAQDLPDAPVTEESMQTVVAILSARVNGLGVAEPRVEREGANRIVVELPGISDPEKALADIGRTAYLEFAEGFDIYLTSAGDRPAEVANALVAEAGLTAGRVEQILAALVTGPQRIATAVEIDRLYVLGDALDAAGAIFAEVPITALTGADLQPGSAQAVYDQQNLPAVSLTFAGKAATTFAELTARRVGLPVYILLDGQIVQTPVVSEPITSGKAQISGYASLQDAFRIAVVLNSGALPVKLVPLAPQVVSASLGADSIARSKTAGVVAVLAVIGFMLLFYRLAGLLANLALAMYMMLVLTALAAINATLTLPGIAGLLLSVGMAVDANVITFERIREELRGGKTIRSAIESGYTRAFSTILDSNITTLLAGGVLFYLGTGPIRGFAVTLIVGILMSLVTAVYASRFLLRLAARSGFLRDPRLFFGAGAVPGVTGGEPRA